MSIPTLQALAASRISPKTKKNIRSPLLQDAKKQIDPAIKIQRTFRKKPTRINRKPELMTESTMRKQIYHHFKNHYKKFVELFYHHLKLEFDSIIYNIGYPIHYRGFKYIIDNIDERFFIILSNIDTRCDLNEGYDAFIINMKKALRKYPKNRNVLNILGEKPEELTNEQFVLKNILSNLKGKLLKNLYEVFLDDKYDNFGADVATANEDPRYEGLSIFEKSSRSSKKEKAKRTIKKYISKLSKKTRKNS